MTRKPLDPIRAGGHTISVPFYGALRISHLYRDGDVVIRDVNIPALISALTTLAREMGAGVPDPVPVIEGPDAAKEAAVSAYDAVIDKVDASEPCAFKRACFRAGWDAARAYLGEVKK